MATSALLLTGCEQPSTPVEDTRQRTLPLSVYTVNYPLEYFAQRIGGEYVQARFPGPTNIDPANWSPDVDTVAQYQQADLILRNGAGYARWAEQVSLPLANQVDTSSAFTELLLPITDKVAHTHGPTGQHVHDNLATTVWLDPELAKLQATAIQNALVKRLPAQTEILNANLIALTDAIWQLDAELSRAFKYRNAEQIIYSHPVYQYLDRRYKLNGISMHWEPNELPSDEEFSRLENMAGALMLWEADPLPETEARLRALGIDIVVFDTSATKPASGDYLDAMYANLQRLQTALL